MYVLDPPQVVVCALALGDTFSMGITGGNIARRLLIWANNATSAAVRVMGKRAQLSKGT